MQTTVRIPSVPNKSHFAMHRWFYKMYQAGLLYDPDEPAKNILVIATGLPTFTPEECEVLDKAMDLMFEVHGDRVHDVSWHFTQKAMGIKPE
jgi:hypothetical protein